MFKYPFVILITFIQFSVAYAQLTPLQVTPETIGLWNFDDDEGDTVLDIAQDPLNGTAFSTTLLAIPGIDPVFGLGRRFTVASSFIDFGPVVGSKLDLTGAAEFSVEAVIQLTAPVLDTRWIYNSENIRLGIINNQLAGVIRQPGGLYGVISERTILQNETYRVGFHYKGNEIALSINGRIDSKLVVGFPLQAPDSASSRAYIGGDILQKFIPGYIDDVRVQDVAEIDMTSPDVLLVEPNTFQVSTSKPNFLINLQDIDSGIDPASIKIFLNGVEQTNLSVSTSSISGQMNDEMQPGVLNEVKVQVLDLVGNGTEKKFFFSYSLLGGKVEYVTDASTIALWHMNDFSPSYMEDSSSKEHHGYSDASNVGVIEGVFSKGKSFPDHGTGIQFDGVRFTNRFTIEGWYKPGANYSSEEILFYNGQVTVARFNGGFLRVTFHTTSGTLPFVSSSSLLPLGELNHLAVTWDGEQLTDNLKFFVNGLLLQVQSAPSNCDFPSAPKVGLIGDRFQGMIDEVRISSIPRISFNIPTLDNHLIVFQSLKSGSSVLINYPELNVVFGSATPVDVNSVKVNLNGVLQPPTSNLVINEAGISGTMSNVVREGLNEISVEFTDINGNLRKKSQFFFKVNPIGARTYEAGLNLAGLWHFEAENPFKDDSGNDAHFSATSVSAFEGKFGESSVALSSTSGHSLSSKLNFNCRSYTLEGYYKIHSNSSSANLFSISGGLINHTVTLNTMTGNIRLNLSSNAASHTANVPEAFPVDSAYHHVALVYDGSRKFSQLLLLVDGVVKYNVDLKSTCNVNSNLSLNVGGSNVAVDEFRISRDAVYSLNVSKPGADYPEVSSTSHQPDSTVSSPTIDYAFTVEDQEGVDVQKTKLFVNGFEQVIVPSIGKTKFLTTFNATLNLIPGANILIHKIYNIAGNEIVKKFLLYRFDQGVSGPYVSDSNTPFLYHFEESTGDYQNSGSSSIAMPRSSWAVSNDAAFGLGAERLSSMNLNFVLNSPQEMNRYTVESWIKKSPGQAVDILSRGSSTSRVFGFSSSNRIIFSPPNSSNNSESLLPSGSLDSEFHHYALVVDAQHLIRNVYLLVDGEVVGSFKLPIEQLNLGTSSSTYFFASAGSGIKIDEFRFSTVPRYELVSVRE